MIIFYSYNKINNFDKLMKNKQLYIYCFSAYIFGSTIMIHFIFIEFINVTYFLIISTNLI